MIKTSVRGGDGYKMVQSELSCGGYVTADDKVTLPNYLVHVPSHNDVIVDIDVEEELNERVNGDD